jgi:molybdopterin converting factor small subunit
MDRKSYIEELVKRNGYCECPLVSDVLDAKRLTQEYLNLRDNYRREVNLGDARIEDLPFLQSLRNANINFREALNQYVTVLNTAIEEGRVVAFINNERGLRKRLDISDLLSSNKRDIVTYHCKECDRQLDVRS